MSHPPTDKRPVMAAALRVLAETGGPTWVTWQGQRLLLAVFHEETFRDGDVVLATHRGYRLASLKRRQRLRKGPEVFCEGTQRVAPRRVRAVVQEAHPRCVSPTAQSTQIP